MAYKRTNWVDGFTPLSSENLNNIEGGIEELFNSLSNYVTQNLNPNGFIQLKNGFILQFGSLKTGTAPVVNQSGTLYYTELTPSLPIPFPNKFLGGVVNVNYAGVSGRISESSQYPKTGARIIIDRYNSSALADITFNYFALGY
ncbi:hypothetical protein CF065_18705 [Clostridium sporogenes]